jgi:hypothetical protein
VTLPHEVVGALTQAERIRGHCDKTMLTLDSITDAVRYVNDASYRDGVNESRGDPQTVARRFLASVSWQMAPPALQALAEKLRRAPRITPSRLAALAIAWREHQNFRPDDFARLEAWRSATSTCGSMRPMAATKPWAAGSTIIARSRAPLSQGRQLSF